MVSNVFAEATVYGKFNVALEYLNTDVQVSDPVWSVESFASRLGIRGKDDANLVQVIYAMEYEVNGDGSSASPFKQRDIFVGVTGAFGSLKMGYMDTPVKVSQGHFDLFNDVVDLDIVMAGEHRVANQINASSAEIEGFKLDVSSVLSESTSQDNGYSMSFSYDGPQLYVALAADQSLPGLEDSLQRMTILYEIEAVRIGALVQQVSSEDVCDSCEVLGYALNLSYRYEAFRFKSQFMSSDQVATGRALGAVGVDYTLASSTVAHVYASRYEDDGLNTGVTRVGIGLIHMF